MKGLFSLLLLAISFTSMAQQAAPDTTHYIYDTSKVEAWYVHDLTSGEAITGYVFKIVRSKFDFQQPGAEEFKKDSLTIRKTKLPVAVMYYIPVTTIDSAIVKKNKGKTTQAAFKTIYVPLPAELVLHDFDKNFDHLLPAADKNK